MSKSVNLFTSNLTGRALVAEKSATRKATAAALDNFTKTVGAPVVVVGVVGEDCAD